MYNSTHVLNSCPGVSRIENVILFLCFLVAGMVTLQNLQNLATLQSLPQVASLAAGLQGMAGLGTQLINTPLNLSASASGWLH
jgi:hypothetical protein